MVDHKRRNALRLMAATAGALALPLPAQTPLKAAWIYVGPVGDGGWTFAHDIGRKAVQEKFGDRVQTTYVENVPEGPDAERVMRDLVQQGYQLIFGTSFGFMEPMLKIARDFPDVKLEHVTGYKMRDNLRTYDSRNYEGMYMCGVLAGAMTKANKLGFVGTLPITEVLRNLDSFTLGAQRVNPDITTSVIWVNAWYDPPKETEAAMALINGGADVLFYNTNTPAVLKTAQAQGKLSFGRGADMSHHGPQAHLGSFIINWAPYYIHAVQEMMDGTWRSGFNSWWGAREDTIDLVSVSDAVNAQGRETLAQVKAELRDGSLQIWKGPLHDNAGGEVLADGVVADDEFLRGIDFYVAGVEGSVPRG